MSKKDQIKKLELLTKALELQKQKEIARKLRREIQLKKLELIEKNLEEIKIILNLTVADISKEKCYCCKEKASRVILHPYFRGTAYLCRTCFSLLIQEKDQKKWIDYLAKKNIEILHIYPALGREYVRFQKRKEK